MGVRQFVKVLECLGIQVRPNNEQPDVLLIDGNEFIHQTIDDLVKEDHCPTSDEIIVQTIISIEKAIEIVRPRKTALVFDGIGPRPKIRKPRQEKPGGFDRKQLFVETDFMSCLEDNIREKFAGQPLLFSGDHVAGEGEHKLIAAFKERFPENTRGLIWGADNDFYFLCLLSGLKNIGVLRNKGRFVFEMRDLFDKLEELNVTPIEFTEATFALGNDFVKSINPPKPEEFVMQLKQGKKRKFDQELVEWVLYYWSSNRPKSLEVPIPK